MPLEVGREMHKLKDQRRNYRWPTHRSLPRDVTQDKYAMLEEYAATRTREVSSMLGPYADATDKHGRLLCRLCVILGDVEPRSVQDAVLRDLNVR